MKQRHYYYIEGKAFPNSSQMKYIRREIECEDTFDGELIMIAFPIKFLKEVSSVFSDFRSAMMRNTSIASARKL